VAFPAEADDKAVTGPRAEEPLELLDTPGHSGRRRGRGLRLDGNQAGPLLDQEDVKQNRIRIPDLHDLAGCG
jgi:hypothetical protein